MSAASAIGTDPVRAARSSRACSGDAGLLAAWREDGFEGQVHSVFASAVNLRCRRSGELRTLAAAGSDNAPVTLRVATESFAPFELVAGMPAETAAGVLRIEDRLAVSLSGAAPWAPALPAWPAGGMPVRWLARFIDSHGASGGIRARVDAATASERQLARRLGEARASLQAALLTGALDEAQGHARRLIGLGPGLTPSGDDYLVGLATVCNLRAGPLEHLRSSFETLAEDSAGMTSDVSSMMMRHASRGRVRECICDLLGAMSRGDHAGMSRYGRRVVAVGATSGTDILVGILAGLELAASGRR